MKKKKPLIYLIKDSHCRGNNYRAKDCWMDNNNLHLSKNKVVSIKSVKLSN